MRPVLIDGDFVLVRHISARKLEGLAEHSPVLVDHPKFGRLIKCLGSKRDGRYRLQGYAPESVSEHEMGWVESRQIYGVILLRIGRRGIMRLAQTIS